MGKGRPGPQTEQRVVAREGRRRQEGAQATPSLQVDLERLFASHRAQVLSLCRRLVSSDERAGIKELEREVRELRQANEILKKASTYFAQAELDRPLKR